MLSPTVWHPDTCQCVIEYLTDDALPNPPLVYSRHLTVCSIHQSLLAQPAARWDAAVDENQTKNAAKAAIAQAVPALATADGDVPSAVVTFGAGLSGKGRAVSLALIGATPQQIALARAALVGKFATGKVVIQ